MRMSISVPDHLAEQVRAHGLPISKICQAALAKAVQQAGEPQGADAALAQAEALISQARASLTDMSPHHKPIRP